MTDHFYRKEDLNLLGKLAGLNEGLFSAFQNFNEKAFEDGVLPAKQKELMAISAAHCTQCPYCIDFHVKKAKEKGATDEEIAEAAIVGIAMAAGAAFAHSSIAMGALE